MVINMRGIYQYVDLNPRTKVILKELAWLKFNEED